MSEAPAAAFPESLDEANRWITQLRDAYHREAAYVRRLEAQVHRERDVVAFAGYWHHARGMHRKPWLLRLRDAVVELESRVAETALRVDSEGAASGPSSPPADTEPPR